MQTPDASVAETLNRAHAALLKDLRKLDEAAGPTSGKVSTELRARLGATRTHLAEHFGFEEQNGYMDKVRKREPRLEHVIQQLAEEHRRLMQSLESLIGECSPGLDNSFREKVRAWVQEVRQHEIHENDVVQDAFTLDIGPED